jgi:outer membrane protein assembly factor BamB
MRHIRFCARSLVASVLLLSTTLAFAAVDPKSDWPAWRGPTRDGIAAPGQNPPIHWSETENIAWKI